MKSTDKSTPTTSPQDGWNESAGFRETFLRLFEPEHAQALQTLALMIHDFVLESRHYGPDPRESPTRQEVRAVAADLRWSSGFLAWVGREREQSSLDPADEVLSELAGRLAAEVHRIAEILERAVGGP